MPHHKQERGKGQLVETAKAGGASCNTCLQTHTHTHTHTHTYPTKAASRFPGTHEYVPISVSSPRLVDSYIHALCILASLSPGTYPDSDQTVYVLSQEPPYFNFASRSRDYGRLLRSRLGSSLKGLCQNFRRSFNTPMGLPFRR